MYDLLIVEWSLYDDNEISISNSHEYNEWMNDLMPYLYRQFMIHFLFLLCHCIYASLASHAIWLIEKALSFISQVEFGFMNKHSCVIKTIENLLIIHG